MILRSSALECPYVGHYWAVLVFFRLGVHDCSREFFFFGWKKGCRSMFRVIVRSSGLECPEVGHCGAVLEFFRLGVHEISRRNNCVLRYI